MAAISARLPLRKLLSTKTRIEFRDNPGQIRGDSFFDLVRRFRTGQRVDPIEVVPRGSNYVIMNGVRRALAAKAAGRPDLEAMIVSSAAAGRSVGFTVPLSEVLFPNDLRG